LGHILSGHFPPPLPLLLLLLLLLSSPSSLLLSSSSFFFWPGQLLVQHLIEAAKSTNLQNTVTCRVVLKLHSKRLQTMPAIFFFIISKSQCIVIITVDILNWKTTLCKTVLDSSSGY
jgi:hypothetical protein